MPSLEDVLGQIQTETAPLRTATLTNLQRILAGAPASSLPAYAPNRAAIENQYGVAMGQARDLLPRGGQLNRAILDLGAGRARSVSDLEAAIRNDAINRAAQLGFGMTPSMVSGAGTSDWQNLQRRNYEQQRLNQMIQNITGIVPLLFGTPATGQAQPGLISSILSLF